MNLPRLVVSATICFLISFHSATASEPVECVQKYITNAGYDIGKIDGALGRRTYGAAKNFGELYDELPLPALSNATAAEWCAIVSTEAGQEILADRYIPELNAPADTVGRRGGLNLTHPLVRENYPNARLRQGYVASLRPGRVTVETDPARIRSGNSSIRMHAVRGDCGGSTFGGPGAWNDCTGGNSRVETGIEMFNKREAYYALSIMMHENIEGLPGYRNPYPDSDINLYQWFQDHSGACFNMSYNTRIKKLTIDMRCEFGKYGEYPVGKARGRVVLSNSDYNVWHEFVIHAKWSAKEDGFFRVLQNGKMVMNYESYTLTPNGQTEVEDHPQIYLYGGDSRASWDQYKTPVTVWFDDMMRSTKLSDIQAKYSFDVEEFNNHSAAFLVSRLQPRAYSYFPPIDSISDPRFEIGTHEVWNALHGSKIEIESAIVTNIHDSDGSLGEKFEFGIYGDLYFPGYFKPLSLTINEPVDVQTLEKFKKCPGGLWSTQLWSDGEVRISINFLHIDNSYEAQSVDCIIAAVPERFGARIRYLTSSFQRIAEEMVNSGSITSIKREGLRDWMTRVASGEIEIR